MIAVSRAGLCRISAPTGPGVMIAVSRAGLCRISAPTGPTVMIAVSRVGLWGSPFVMVLKSSRC